VAITERLALIIDADGKGAIREMDKVGKAAEKDLGRAESRIDKMGASFTSNGTKMMAASAVIGVALWNAAESTSDLAEAADYSARVFGEAAGEIDKFADSSAKIGMSSRMAHEAATTFADLLKATKPTTGALADMSIEMTQLAADMASAKNTTPEDAITALGAALRGESEPIRRYGVMLDDATLKQRALDMGLVKTTTGTLPISIKMQAAYAEILEQTAGMQGNFAETADGAANKSRIMAAQIENSKAALGEGFLPVMSTAIGLLSGVASGFSSVNEASGGMVANVMGVGTVVLGVGGALSFVAGKAIEARESLKGLATSQSKVGQWASANSAALGGVGLALAAAAVAWSMYKQKQDEARARTQAMAETLDEQTGLLTENSEALLLNNLQKREQLDDLDRAQVGIDEYTAAVSDAAAADLNFNEISEGGTGVSGRQVNALRDRTDAMSQLIVKLYDADELTAGLLNTLYEESTAYQQGNPQVLAKAAVLERVTEETNELTGATEDATGATEDQTAATQEAEKAWAEAEKSLKKYLDGIDDFYDIIDSSIDSTIAWEASIDSQRKTIEDNGLAWNWVRGEIDLTTEAGRKVMKGYQDQRDVIAEAGKAVIENGGSHEEARAKVDNMTTALQNQMRAAGYTDEQIATLTGNLGLMPDQVQIIFATPGIDAATANITNINSLLGRTASLAAAASASGNSLLTTTKGKPPGRARGGPVDAGGAYIVGEEGPELMVMGSKSGTVIPAQQTAAMLGGGGGGGGTTTVVLELDGREFYRKVVKPQMQSDIQGNQGFGGR